MGKTYYKNCTKMFRKCHGRRRIIEATGKDLRRQGIPEVRTGAIPPDLWRQDKQASRQVLIVWQAAYHMFRDGYLEEDVFHRLKLKWKLDTYQAWYIIKYSKSRQPDIKDGILRVGKLTEIK